MSSFFRGLFANEVLWVSISGWIIAQGLKGIFWFFKDKKIDFRRFTGPGGMPSSHSSFVTALTTAIGLKDGFGSTTFAIAVVFAFIVMYDASGVRRAAGKQAEVLNKIVDDMARKHVIREERLKELLGHTPVEVLGGAILGIILALLFL